MYRSAQGVCARVCALSFHSSFALTVNCRGFYLLLHLEYSLPFRLNQKEKEMIKRMDQADKKMDHNKNETNIMMNRMFIAILNIAIIHMVKSVFEK